MTTKLNIFISSKMVELKAERDALYALLPTLNYGVRPQQVAIIVAGILTTPVRMMDKRTAGLPLSKCHVQSGFGQFGRQMGCHAQSNDLARVQVHDTRNIQIAFISGNIGDVGQPDRIGLGGVKVLLKHIRFKTVIGIGLRGTRLPSARPFAA